ncbi:MAG: 4-(cytidine 5'-diphospho)-2-C-methyl-D-erythritol kinase, partial [Planctomycetota bacterium]
SRYAIIWADDAMRKTDIDWSITKDLAVRAHLLLEAELKQKFPVQLKLEKRIPVGAGLGGGSSDAAAMLLGCNALFDLGLSLDDLHELAARLGSDVPFFLTAASAIAEGFGERLDPIRIPDDTLHIALFMPDFTCGTPEVYRSFDALHPGDALPSRFGDQVERVRLLPAAIASGSAALSEADLFNDLAPAAFARYPDLSDDAREIESIAERKVHVSGSGSALFVICDDAMHAEYLSRTVAEQADIAARAVSTSWTARPTASTE